MLRENGVTCQVSDIHLDNIARSYCRKWRSLSPHLEVPSIVVDDIDKCQASEEEKRRSFFFKWKERKGASATYRSLIKGLLEIDCQQDAESVCKLLKGSSFVSFRMNGREHEVLIENLESGTAQVAYYSNVLEITKINPISCGLVSILASRAPPPPQATYSGML